MYRSASTVMPDDDRDARAALTTIFFLLIEGQTGAWHRVPSDEVWHFHEGEPLALTWADADGANALTQVLGPVGADQMLVAVVPAGCWQTARPRRSGAYTLVGCTVAPGFAYADVQCDHLPQ